MHSQNIAHRDIKLENILIDTSERIKIIDFGFSIDYKSKEKQNKYAFLCGTPCYMAPELLEIKQKTCNLCKIDVWALGVLLFRMLVGTYPFSGDFLYRVC